MTKKLATTDTFRAPPIIAFGDRLLRLRRIVRIALCALVALIATLFTQPLIDFIYLSRFFDFSTRLLPSWIAAGIGIVLYGVGWWVLVSPEPPFTMRQRGLAAGYIVFGAACLLGVALLIVTGALTASAGVY